MSYPIKPLPDELRQRAVAHLQDVLAPQVFEEVRKLHTDDPDGWWTMHHMFFGMTIRNILRGAILDEELPGNRWDPNSDIEFRNWDDYYIEVLEEAAGITDDTTQDN